MDIEKPGGEPSTADTLPPDAPVRDSVFAGAEFSAPGAEFSNRRSVAYGATLSVILFSAALFGVVWWIQYYSGAKAEQEYAALEQTMKAAVAAYQEKGSRSKDPRPEWGQKWRVFAERYPSTPQASKAHLWALSLLKSMEDSQGLANYLDVAVRHPDSTAVPAILNESVSLYLQTYGAQATSERLEKIARSSRERENQASAYVMLTYLLEDDAKKTEALQRFLTSYGTTRAAVEARSALEELKRVGVGAPAPQFEFTDLNGNTVSLKSLLGKWVLVDFWASWCPPCVEEIPAMKSIFSEFQKHEKFAMVGVSLDYDRESLKIALKKNGINWPQYIDGKVWDTKISREYDVISLPHTVLVDPEGKIRYKRLSGANLKKVLAEKLQ